MTLPSERTPGPDHAAELYEVVEPGTTEPKVVAATAGAGAGAVVAAFLLYLLDELVYGGYQAGAEVPLPVVGFVGLVSSAAIAFVAGRRARHVNRVR